MDGRAVVMRAASEGAAGDQTLLQAGWDLAELARSYQRFVGTFEPIRPLLAGRTAPPAEVAFVIRTLLIHEYRKIHLRDPVLPYSLLPKGWIGVQAYESLSRPVPSVFAAAEEHVSSVAETLAGKLARALARDVQRFGGLNGLDKEALNRRAARSA